MKPLFRAHWSWIIAFAFCAFCAFCAGPAKAGKPVGDDAFGALRAMEPAKPKPGAIGEKFAPLDGEIIALLGGTNVVEEPLFGYFETLLDVTWPEKKMAVRNLGWQADTVYRQQRPLYFYDPEHHDERAGSTGDLRKRIQPDTILVRFGKMESLDGMEALPEFRAAYANMLDRLMEITPRVIVVTPTPFFKTGPAARLAKERNAVLASYCLAMAELSGERDLFLADLYQFEPDRKYSDDGLHLNAAGQKAVAERLLLQLNGQPVEMDFEGEIATQLRQTIVRKNRVWFQYFRPTNWAFLYGDRQHVPSSRDHIDSEKRWFPFELERALPLIAELETQIYDLAKK